ncbi:MAG: DUF4832 domain-containing protein [bacterium]
MDKTMAFKKMNFSLALIALLLTPLVSLIAAGDIQTTSFKEVDTLFSNPGQGWMGRRFHGSVEYYRFNWVDIEPEKGVYNWKPIDDRLARLQKSGGSLSLRVMTASAHSSGYYSSPKWLFDQGCKGYEYNVGGGDPTSGGKAITRIEPEYSDPIYLAEHSAFIAALGKRYDGHPNMEFLDIGSYGIWGEWHTKHPAPIAVRKQIVDMYVQAFRKTALVFMTDDQEGLSYALSFGTGLRRDGVGSPWHEQNWIGSKKYANVPDMANVWKKSPIVFEWFGDYAYLQSRNWSFDAAVNFMVSNHVTMINDNIGKVPPEAMPQLEKLARLAGYRFVLREIAHEKTVTPKGVLNVKMKWANVGVGKLYRPFKLQISLKNATDQTVATVIADADPRDWLPGEREITSTMKIANVPSGTYTLAVSLTDSANQRPSLKLAMDAPEKDGWYSVGSVIVGSMVK